jgi:hypothetical protein
MSTTLSPSAPRKAYKRECKVGFHLELLRFFSLFPRTELCSGSGDPFIEFNCLIEFCKRVG